MTFRPTKPFAPVTAIRTSQILQCRSRWSLPPPQPEQGGNAGQHVEETEELGFLKPREHDRIEPQE